MKLVSWNVNGLRAVLKKGFTDWLDAEQPDLVCLQEVKARPEQLPTDWAAGYTAHWFPAEKPGYAGVLTLAKDAPGQVIRGIGEPTGDAEGRVLTLGFAEFYLVNVYTPNAQNELRRLAYRTEVWDPAFRAHCQRLAEDKPVIFCGDLNVAHTEIDLARPQANRQSAGFTDAERAGFTAHLEAGFVDTFRHFHPDAPGHYSWWSYRGGARRRNVGWRLDYFCVSEGALDRVRAAAIQSAVMGSDHCPVTLEWA